MSDIVDMIEAHLLADTEPTLGRIVTNGLLRAAVDEIEMLRYELARFDGCSPREFTVSYPEGVQ